jgi:hypothetical protein
VEWNVTSSGSSSGRIGRITTSVLQQLARLHDIGGRVAPADGE